MKCETCRFFELTMGNAERGECRQDSPRVYFVGHDDGAGYMPIHDGYWPTVSEEDGCGKHEPKDDPPLTEPDDARRIDDE